MVDPQTVQAPPGPDPQPGSGPASRRPDAGVAIGLAVGTASGVLGLGVAQLVAGVLAPASAPLVALGDVMIDNTPPWLREWAKHTFGFHDKQVLLSGALLVALVLSAVAGVLAVRGSRAAPWVVLGLGAVAALAAATRPAAGMLAVLPSVVGALTGMWIIGVLGRMVRQWWRLTRLQDPVQLRYEKVMQRRAVTGIGLAAAAGVLTGAGGQLLGGRLRGAQQSREAVRLPVPASPAPAAPAGVSVGVRGASPFFTPAEDFYRIDTALVVPLLQAKDWKLRIHGMVDREVTLTFAQLLASPLVERDITLMCVSNPIGGDLTGNARWIGLPLKPLLEQAGPHADADMVLSTSSDGFTAGSPLEVLTDGRDAILAIGMNGQPLPFEHGYPVRIVVPGLYGYVSATKWVTDLEVTRFDRAEGYWTPRGWSAKGPVKTGSRIDVPADGASVRAGTVAVAGIAWHQHLGIEAVQVRVDGGAWQPATLGAQDTIDTWRQWVYRWPATAGRHRLEVRATDRSGVPQTGEILAPAPNGATGWHTVHVDVR